MSTGRIGLLELGSNSLKYHLVDADLGEDATVRTTKIPWRISHDYFLRGRLDSGMAREVIEAIENVKLVAPDVQPNSVLAIATGVFREFDSEGFFESVRKETGVRVRVISGEHEAALMARGYRDLADDFPVVYIDLGGATTEWVWIQSRGRGRWGSLPLGAIRNEYLFRHLKDRPAEYLQSASAYCDEHLRHWPFHDPVKAVGTGGTVKALSKYFSSPVINLDSLRHLVVHTLKHGPPEGLKPSRHEIFLSGLTILWRVVVRCKSGEIHYSRAAVREGMVKRLLRLLREMPREDLHATLLLHGTRLRQQMRGNGGEGGAGPDVDAAST